MEKRYRLYGANGSPYSVKVRAALRYRRIPFDWVRIDARNSDVLKRVKVPVIPVIESPDGHFANDSTPLLLDLESSFTDRRIVPEDPALAFLVHLIEDMADEWGTKLMFHFRWHDPSDQQFCSQWIARDRVGPAGATIISETANTFRERQLSRLSLVGVQAANRAVLVESYRRVLALFNELLTDSEFLFGARPSLADFAWYGQLWELGIDPTPAQQMKQTAPRVFPWLLRIDDLSGHEGGAWLDLDDELPSGLVALLKHCADVYLPFLVANAEAVMNSAENVRVSLLGLDFSQAPFKYQAKCLERLRQMYGALSAEQRLRINAVLEETGCLAFLKL